VIVNTRSDKSFRGILWATEGDWLQLRQAELLDGASGPVIMVGDQLIERGNVDFIQVLPVADG
jgi:hypothetical protein